MLTFYGPRHASKQWRLPVENRVTFASHHHSIQPGPRRVQPLDGSTRVRSGANKTIDNLKSDFCDDFQCNSSPAVEQTIRSFARDIERHNRWSLPIFALDVTYAVRSPSLGISMDFQDVHSLVLINSIGCTSA
jgi:hypothetical protein